MMLNYESAVCYIDEHIQYAVSALKIGRWVLISEDEILKDLTKARYSFLTKREAIGEFKGRCLDARRIPKVQRLNAGHYYYFVKDCDTGRDRTPVSIIQLTRKNVAGLRKMLREELESIRDEKILTVYDNEFFTDEGRDQAVRNSVRSDIYDPEGREG